MVKYLAETKEVKNKQKFFREVISDLSNKSRGEIMTIAESLRFEGRQETLERFVLNLLSYNEPIEKIVKLTGLSVSEIENIKNKKLI